MVARLAVLLALLAGCGDDGGAQRCEYRGMTYALGESFPAGDGCNACTCTADGASCTERACPDAGMIDPMSCAPHSGCTTGPACNGRCCGQGEKCVGGVCQCGPNASCSTGDTCAAAGPIGEDACGSICCGKSGPCPQ